MYIQTNRYQRLVISIADQAPNRYIANGFMCVFTPILMYRVCRRLSIKRQMATKSQS